MGTLRSLIVILVVAVLVSPSVAGAKGDRSAKHIRPVIHPCLAEIVDRENPGWEPTRYNRQGSGAYGLPQALPGSKMASAGADWRTNPMTQLRWMRGYVDARYGGPCEALAFWKRNHWY